MGDARAAKPAATTYPLGAVVRLTGLSEHVIRAWERRYGAVRPIRTPGGTRRYTDDDVGRLRLLRAAVEAGHRISDLAALPDEAIERRLSDLDGERPSPLQDLYAAIERLDLGEVERLLSMQFAALGPSVFAREVATPLLREVGERWARGELSVAAEHLVSSVTRGILGVALRSVNPGHRGPRILLTTPSGERHEFGLLLAALTALAAGADAVYLGPDLPVREVVQAAGLAGVAAVAVSVVSLEAPAANAYVDSLRAALPEDVELWIGGAGALDVRGGDHLELRDLEPRIDRLARRRLRAGA